MAIGSMVLGNVLNAVQTAGSASGGASASSGQGGAGLGFNILGAPGDPAGVIFTQLQNRKTRKETERNNEVSRAFTKAQTAVLDYQLKTEQQKAKRQNRIRDLVLGYK